MEITETETPKREILWHFGGKTGRVSEDVSATFRRDDIRKIPQNKAETSEARRPWSAGFIAAEMPFE